MIKLEKIERILFYVFLFLVPFQIRALVQWNGNEWNSIFLYLTDILFLLVLALWIKRSENIGIPNIFLWIFLAVAFVSIIPGIFVGSGTIAFSYWIRLIMFVLLFVYVRKNIPNIFQVLIASGVFQALLAIAQFIKQSSLGERGLGIRFIEAGVFTPGAPGVATFVTENGDKIMRGYGSFPHPNILAGFLMLSIFCLYVLQMRSKSTNIIQIIRIPIFFLLIFALFITFSRTAIVVFLVMSLIMFLLMIKKKQAIKLFGIFLISVIISIVILFPFIKARFFNISLEEQAVDLRFFYNKMAVQMIKQRPLLGIGIGNFVWHSQNYPAYLRAASKVIGGNQTIPSWIYQPVHNIYLLIGAEMGLIGLLIFMIFIGDQFRRGKHNIFLFLFIGFLIIGLMDHYFWTFQPGGIIFWLALALARNNLCNT